MKPGEVKIIGFYDPDQHASAEFPTHEVFRITRLDPGPTPDTFAVAGERWDDEKQCYRPTKPITVANNAISVLNIEFADES